jgi:hypothetical protein
MSKPYRAWVAAAAAAALLASLHVPRVLAETVVIGDEVKVRQTDVASPKRGMSMAQVQKHFGEPRERHPTVGTPPITRWDYDHFAVFFEKDLVIDAVVPGAAGAGGGSGDAGPSATPVSAPEAAPIPAATPTAAGPALDAAGIPLHQPEPIQPAAATPATAPATTQASAPAASPAAAPHAAAGTPKGTDVPLSNVSLHH